MADNFKSYTQAVTDGDIFVWSEGGDKLARKERFDANTKFVMDNQTELWNKVSAAMQYNAEVTGDLNAVVAGQIAELQKIVENAPEALDTLKEIADSLNNDVDFYTTVINLLALKANKVLDTDLIPDVANVRCLGSADKPFKDLFLSNASLYIDGQQVMSATGDTINVSADEDQNVRITTTGVGDIEIYPKGTGTIELKGTVEVTAGKLIRTSDGSPFLFDGSIDVDGNIVAGNLSATNLNGANINNLITDIGNLKILVASDDTTLDTLQEIVDFISINRETLNTLGISSIAGLQAALTSLSSAISDEVDDRDAAIASAVATINASIASVQQAITQEAQTRYNETSSNLTKINQEAVARENADTTLTQSLASNVYNINASITSLTNSTNTAVETLQDNLDIESEARLTADSGLSNRIGTLEGTYNFGNIVVGSTTVAADALSDTLTLVAGTNITLTPNATNDSITIAANDTSVNYSELTGTVPTWNQSTTGNAATATKLATARTINGVSFDGTANITVADSTKVVANSAITAGTGTKITYDAKGLVTGSTTLSASDIPTLNQNTTGSAGSVVNSQTIKFDTGTTEGTDLYTFNGSSAKTVDIKAGTNVTLTKAAGTITISANDPSVAIGEITGLATGASTFLATPSSANLAALLTDETGTGANVFATSPTLVTPNIGVATGTSFNSITGLSSTTPVMNGTAAVGTGTTAARADHVHATDTSRMSNSQALAITGDVTAASTALNTGTIATTLASVGTAGTYTKVTTDAKGRVTSGTTLSASDIPSLDASKITSGTIDAARLPSYVDDVIEGATTASFPTTGETGKIYVALDTNKTYRWSGSAYVYITSGAVDSVAGKTGVVTLVKGDVGLGSVDNTADSAKPISTLTQAALNLKADKSDTYTKSETDNVVSTAINGIVDSAPGVLNTLNELAAALNDDANFATTVSNSIAGVGDDLDAHITDTSNPHLVTKAQVGLGNVDNTSDANKPISTLTQNALNGKVDVVAGKALSTNDYTTVEKTKLAGIATNANNYSLPTASATVLGGIKIGTNLSIDANGVVSANDTSIDWSEVQNKPDPVVTVTLTGDVTGSANATLTDLASGTISVATTIAANSVALGTDTTGNYVAGNTAGTGIAITGTAGEGWSPTISLATVGTAGTYTKVTTDAFGRVTAGTTLSASDIPSLDASKITSGTIDAARLPSYVDDVIEGTNLASFPATGETGKIYVALDTNKTYRWSGSAYVYITSGAVDSVAGKTGVVTLVKGDVGLGSVDNTADSAKNVLSATKLTTARTINGVSFDGTANITVADSTKQPLDADLTAIAGLTGTTGLLKKTAADTWTLDTNAYVTSSGVTSVTGTAPIVSSGGTTPAISISAATTSAAGSMSAADKTKLDGIATGATANTGTVTSVGGTGSYGGLTLTGTVTTTGNLTLGGTPTGTWPISVSGSSASTTGNAATATKLATARTIGMTGDVTWTSASFDGSGNVTGTATLANSGVTAGTYGKVTVDAKGRVTSGTTLTMEDIPSASYKKSVVVATTANITLSATQTIDGIAVVAGDRVLVKNQTTASQNGIYVVNASTWTRALDADTADEIASAIVNVDKGTVNGGQVFTNTFKSTDTLGTTSMSWYRGMYESGTWGISVSGNAATATALQTARTINGVSFNGTANITVADSTKEPTITAGTTAQYWRGDKSWQTLNASAVGLGNVSNTAQVTSVTGTAPIVSSGGTTPAISISAATTSAAGSMSATDKTKLDGISGTNTGDETTSTIKTKLGITTLSGSNTGDQTITLTGDVTGSGTGSFAATLANSGVTAGTYTKVTTDAKGRITSGTTLSASDIPTLNQNTTGSSGSCTGNAATATTATNLSGGTVSATTGTFSGAVSVLSLTETSDRNFKDNIATLETGLIDSIRPVSFNWKDGGKKAYGVIAQELEEVVPEAVVTSEEGVKSVQYTQLIPLLIAEVQALRNEINILKGAK